MPTPRFHPAPLTLAMAMVLASYAATPPAHAQATAPVSITLPAQPLGAALNELARQAKLQLMVNPDLVAGKRAPALSGTFSVREALDRLLAGSGLTAVVDGASVVLKPAAASTGQNEATLQAVQVTASATAADSPLGYLSKEVVAGALGNKPVLDTPFSISVVGSEDIVTRGAKSIGQIFANDVAVYTPTSSSTVDWWGTQIRGLQVFNYYIDDIPMELLNHEQN